MDGAIAINGIALCLTDAHSHGVRVGGLGGGGALSYEETEDVSRDRRSKLKLMMS